MQHAVRKKDRLDKKGAGGSRRQCLDNYPFILHSTCGCSLAAGTMNINRIFFQYVRSDFERAWLIICISPISLNYRELVCFIGIFWLVQPWPCTRFVQGLNLWPIWIIPRPSTIMNRGGIQLPGDFEQDDIRIEKWMDGLNLSSALNAVLGSYHRYFIPAHCVFNKNLWCGSSAP